MNEHKHIFTNFNINNKKICFCVFDYDYYKKENINNEGLDIISKCIHEKKCWEKRISEILIEILKNGNHLFIDLGCHIGYYSILASLYNNKCISIDNNKHYLNCFYKTIIENYLNNIKIKRIDINNIEKLKEITQKEKIRCVKISLNGNELVALSMFKPILQKKNIDYLIINYKKNTNGIIFFLKIIEGYGYKIYDIGLSNNDEIYEKSNHLNNLEPFRINKENIQIHFTNIKVNETFILCSI